MVAIIFSSTVDIIDFAAIIYLQELRCILYFVLNVKLN